jgi:hypothetical protein
MVEVNKKIFLIKFAHSLIFWWQTACLFYILFAAFTGTFNVILLIAIASILLNGILLLINRGRCPFTILAESHGAVKGSVTDIFLPDCIARNIFRVSFPFFIVELITLAVRYFAHI